MERRRRRRVPTVKACDEERREVWERPQVLCGELPEAVYVDRVRMERCLRELWTAVDVQMCGGGAPTGLISMESALKALARFLPNKSQPMQVRACVRV